MNILIINHYAGSVEMGMEFRPYYIARELIKLGHKVLILSADYSHLRIKNPKIKKPIEFIDIEGVPYCLIKTRKYKGNGLERGINIFNFLSYSLIFSSLICKNKPDIVIASSTYPFDYIIAKVISIFNGARTVFELHDIWPLSLCVLHGYSQKNYIIRIIKFFEHYALLDADLIISILSNAKLYFSENKLCVKKHIYIPNGIDISKKDMHTASEQTIAKIKEIKSRYSFTVMYCGGFAKANAIDDLIKVARINSEMAFILIGDGSERALLERIVRKYRIKNIFFLGSFKKEELQSIMEFADCLYLGTKSSELYKYGVAMNKLYDYMLSKKPIVFATNNFDNPVNKSLCGFTVGAGNIGEISKAINKIARLNIKERERIGLFGHNYLIKNHDYFKLAKRYAKELENLYEAEKKFLPYVIGKEVDYVKKV